MYIPYRTLHWVLVVIVLTMTLTTGAQEDFRRWFENRTMRVDYFIAGDANSQEIFFDCIKMEPYWGGSVKNLTDPSHTGDYRYRVFDQASGSLMFSRGFSDLFFEWQMTEEAKIIRKSFQGTITFPWPRSLIRVEIDRRDRDMTWDSLFSMEIDPGNMMIHRDSLPDYPVTGLYVSGDPSSNIDIVVIPEGYTHKEMRKFRKDVKRFADFFLSCEPFNSYYDRFSFHMVEVPSAESGTDCPRKGDWKQTILHTHFNTFGSDRYLTTGDYHTVRDIAACAPYDQIYILVNSREYGGGGIYNYYNLCTSDHRESMIVFVHEFGHAFAGLADEYAYEDTDASLMYDLSVEPWQANISSLADFSSKWISLVDSGVPVPTPSVSDYKGRVGAFEGAGYVKKQMYRPSPDCRMRSNHTSSFCPVCRKAIVDMIRLYTE
jgi:hypothetical protein